MHLDLSYDTIIHLDCVLHVTKMHLDGVYNVIKSGVYMISKCT